MFMEIGLAGISNRFKLRFVKDRPCSFLIGDSIFMEGLTYLLKAEKSKNILFFYI